MSTDLRRTIRGLQNKEILVPAIYAALNDPQFEGFTIDIEPWESRPPDGYFHPSTQATWNVRQLALYLSAPHLIDQEKMGVTSIFAITQGHFWHMFIQHILEETGLLLETEVGFTDEKHRRRGHMDGLLKDEGLEIKTINPYKINKIKSETDLYLQKPGYWAQAQEYLDVFNLPQMRFLFISPSYPFPMKEFVVKAHPEHQMTRRQMYLAAIEMAAKNTVSLTECCGDPNNCAARYACDQVRMVDARAKQAEGLVPDGPGLAPELPDHGL